MTIGPESGDKRMYVPRPDKASVEERQQFPVRVDRLEKAIQALRDMFTGHPLDQILHPDTDPDAESD